MAKKKPECKDARVTKRNEPEFKPGDKPYCQFGNDVLNQNVPWDEIVNEIIAKGVTVSQIATELNVDNQVISQILEQKYDNLNFKAGARLITIHYRTNPLDYCDR